MDIALIPESAPFSPEQRAWLNGFLAGWMGLNPDAAGSSLPVNGFAAPAAQPKAAAPPERAPEPEPWHDSSVAIDERLRLAEGKPLARRLMAAMAQLDCGSCGYLCKTYAEAIASGAEPRLTLCSPGGSETSKTLKRILKESPPGANGTSKNGTHSNGVHVNGVQKNSAPRTSTNGWSRENPYTAKIIRTVNLNRAGSEKETRHVEIDLGSDGPKYAVGDSLGIYPRNCDTLVDEIITVLGARPDAPVAPANRPQTTLRAALLGWCGLSEVTESLLEQLAESATDQNEAARLLDLRNDDEPIAGCDVLDVLQRFPSARLAPEAFIATLGAIAPRLYSISSSPMRYKGQVHLTVRRVIYDFNDRTRKGVASTMLADRVAPGSPVRVFVQKSHGFTLPADPQTSIIMIGPGTGIAPFRAFLHERDEQGATGKSWLFFGDRSRAYDFLYEEELAEFHRRGVLTRLDTAFSRDQDQKLYVQHRLIEHGEELYAWLRDGAHVYVCGDAKRMASDVDRALRQVVQQHGPMSEALAGTYVTELTTAGRYKRDVY